MPSSKSCGKSVTEFSALNLISTPLQLFVFKQPKGIPVPMKTRFTKPMVFSLQEDLEELPRSPRFILKSRAAITSKISKFIIFILHRTTPRVLKTNKLRAPVQLSLALSPVAGLPIERSPHKSLFLGILQFAILPTGRTSGHIQSTQVPVIINNYIYMHTGI